VTRENPGVVDQASTSGLPPTEIERSPIAKTNVPQRWTPDESGPDPEERPPLDITRQLLQIVSERTGYPAEILDLNRDMDAELSIDSIKRVEILGALQQVCFPDAQSRSQEDMEELTKIKTLQGIVDWFSHAVTQPAAAENKALPEGHNDTASDQKNGQSETLARFLLKAVETPKKTSPLQVMPGSLFVITDDQQGVAAGIGDELQSLGAHVALVRMGERVAQINRGFYEADLTDESAVTQLLKLIRKENHGAIAGIIHLLPLRKHKPFANIDFKTWQRSLSLGVKSLFHLAKAAHEDLTRTAEGGRSWIIAATEGIFEKTQSETFFPGHGAIAGLVKTMALEWPDIHCQVIDFDRQTQVPELTNCILTEMAVGDREVEVGYKDGKRQILRSLLMPLSSARPSNLTIDSNSVILMTGGGRGITAEIAGELARQYQPTLLLVGKSAFPETEDPVEIANLNLPQELKAAILEQKRQNGEAPTARDLEAAFNQLRRERELRNTLATLQQAGARVRYFQTDVCDEHAFGALIDKIYSTYDKIDGFIHGAGILEDKLIVDKTSDSFDRVLNTKADSGFILSKKLRPDSLKFLVFFTSIAGRFGNRGQCDYAAGNEVLNKLALYLDQQWPGRVVALNWGPWAKTGMVSPGVRKQFADRGVQLISPEAGRRALLDELKFGQKGQVEIIVGDGPWEKIAAERTPDFPDALALLDGTKLKGDGRAQELEFTLDAKNDPYLLDHQLDGKPVFPTAMAMELMAETVRRAWPGWEIIGIQSLQVLHGVIIKKDAQKIRVVARPQSDLVQESSVHDVLVEIHSDDQSERAAFRGLVQLAKRFPESPVLKNDKLATLRPFSLSVPEAYQQWLFHGRCFQGISHIDGINEHGLSAVVKPSSPSDCLQKAAANQWLLDPIVIDCGFQLAILWEREQHGMTPLPARFKTFRRFGSTGDGPLQCYLHARTEAEGHILLVDITFLNQQGRVVSMVEQMEFSCSNALNRLAEAAMALSVKAGLGEKV
ncbi:MAG: SDR family NAD(P)-dependent oxidoreductase, partial [bacterium]